MRSFSFKAKIIGDEKYLTYIMGEETELDEDVLDYCEENTPKELVDIIYEEDDDYDYLTYDITGKTSLDDAIKSEMRCEGVLVLLRNIANEMISLKEQAVKLNYILLNRQFMYIDDELNISFICLPVESQGSLSVEFKGFIRQLLANMKYDVDEDLNYVGKLLTYINGDSFNLRGLIGLSEALMNENGISFEEAGGIETDGVEVMNSEDVSATEDTESVKNFMDSLAADDAPLPEIGDDEEEEEEEDASADDELESILPAGMKAAAAEEEPELESIVPEIKVAEDTTIPEIKDIPEAVEIEEEKPEVKPVDEFGTTENLKSEDIPEAVEIKEEKPEVKPVEESGITETLTAEEEAKAAESFADDEVTEMMLEEEKTEIPFKEKETDQDVLKNRIKALAGDNSLKSEPTGLGIRTEAELDDFLGSKPPVIKKNVVKVNRAAIIQNVAASEADEEEQDEEKQVPIIEEISEDMNVEKKKPKSNSILSKSVEAIAPAVKSTTNVVNIAKAIPYLIRVNTEERIMLSKTTFKIGKASRGVDYSVGGNGAISRQHAIIIRRDDVSYIKDNKSTNHTYVNDKQVEEGEEAILTHDSKIRLGDEEFIFKIR